MPLTSQNDADNNALAANTQVLGDEQASAAFSELEPSRQILVFRSIQEALEADPPRPEASFANCVAAYGAVEDVLEAGQTGQLDNDKLALLQQRRSPRTPQDTKGIPTESYFRDSYNICSVAPRR